LREMMRPEAQTWEPLSEREREVLVLLAQGAANKEIAERLVITEGTVKNHVSNILAKLQVENRTQAADIARKRGLV
jgi:DNA-binding NarL/FixJ family response regulator